MFDTSPLILPKSDLPAADEFHDASTAHAISKAKAKAKAAVDLGNGGSRESESHDGKPMDDQSQFGLRKRGLMPRNPLLRNISYLLAVDENRNFTRAADALCVSQSALSQKVRQLEDELGAQLFDRGGRVVRLTEFGNIYLEYARRAYYDLLTAQRAVKDVHDLSRGQLRVAFTPTFTEYLVAPVIEHFHEKYPGVIIEMTEMSLDAVETALVEDQVDLAFGFTDVRSDEVEAEPLFPEQLMLVVGNDHPLATQSSPVTPEQFAKIPLALLTTNFVSRFYVESYFTSREMQPTVALQANSISAVLKIVSHGKIATILPSSIEFEHRNFQYVSLNPAFPVRTAALLRYKRAYRSVASTAFAASVMELLDDGALSSLRTLKNGSADPDAQ